MKRSIHLSGYGQAYIALQKKGIVPLSDLPILRSLPSLGEKIVFLSENEQEQGGIKLLREEMPISCLQDGDDIYVISKQRTDASDGRVSLDILARHIKLDGEVLASEPTKMKHTSYFTNDAGSETLRKFYDGKSDVPGCAIRCPLSTTGYKHHFILEYASVFAYNLKTDKRVKLVDRGADVCGLPYIKHNLIGIRIPASKVPLMIEEGAETLEAVFEKEDLEEVARINEMNDKAHSCWGDHSCIERKTFELTNTFCYPTYFIGMGLDGKVYQAMRIEPA